MKKLLLASCLLLGSCATAQQQNLVNNFNTYAAQVVGLVSKACNWAVPVENAAAILATMVNLQPITQAVTSAANSICGAVAPHASVVPGYIPRVNGIRVRGHGI